MKQPACVTVDTFSLMTQLVDSSVILSLLEKDRMILTSTCVIKWKASIVSSVSLVGKHLRICHRSIDKRRHIRVRARGLTERTSSNSENASLSLILFLSLSLSFSQSQLLHTYAVIVNSPIQIGIGFRSIRRAGQSLCERSCDSREKGRKGLSHYSGGGGRGKEESDPVRVHNDRFALMRERGRVDLSIRSSVQHVRRDTERKIVLES